MLEQLEDWIKSKWTEDSSKWNSYASDQKGIKHIKVKSSITEKGSYSWISLTCEGSFDITTPMDALNSWLDIFEEYSWLGETASIPDLLTQEEVVSWAALSLHYLRQDQKDDTNHNYLHEGQVLAAFDEKGAVKINKSAGVKYVWTDSGADPKWDFEEVSFLLADAQ